MHRVELAIGRQVPRVGLSATLGDMSLAAKFLRPSLPDSVQLIESKDGGQELKVLIKGYIEGKTEPDEERDEDDPTSPYVAIGNDLYRTLRGSNNLVFPNSRSNVEKYTDRLRRLCEQDRVPNQFWAHHGSLSKTYREETEQALKSGDVPATAICTSTLELGIDIGSVKSICQIGRPLPYLHCGNVWVNPDAVRENPPSFAATSSSVSSPPRQASRIHYVRT